MTKRIYIQVEASVPDDMDEFEGAIIDDFDRNTGIALLFVDPFDIEADYDVVEKDFPDDLPETWVDPDDRQELTITWFGNFGLKKKSDDKFEDKLPKGKKYQVELPKGRGKMVYFDGESVQKLAGEVKGNVFVGELDLGDPPVGGGDPT